MISIVQKPIRCLSVLVFVCARFEDFPFIYDDESILSYTLIRINAIIFCFSIFIYLHQIKAHTPSLWHDVYVSSSLKSIVPFKFNQHWMNLMNRIYRTDQFKSTIFLGNLEIAWIPNEMLNILGMNAFGRSLTEQ